MINAWNLLWICPLCAFMGVMCTAIIKVGDMADDDERSTLE